MMLDNSIFAHSQFAEAAEGPQGPRFGVHNQHYLVCGFIRKKLDTNIEYQAQKDSLFTVGRLIREGRFEAFSYQELRYERVKGFKGEGVFDALDHCKVTDCPPAIERSRFQQGNFFNFIRKGGKNDKKLGVPEALSQITFMQMLCDLNRMWYPWVLDAKDLLGLTDFEIDSFRNLECFRKLCAISQSSENYPDMFHLWTAQRNHMDVFLTLEKKLPAIGNQIEKSKGISVEYPTKVCRPIEFLHSIGITDLDLVPIEPGKFYPFIEVWDRWQYDCREQMGLPT
ncbi:MAG: hypothetical protein ACLP7O_03005 [Terracidiphilus sp.]